MARAVSPSLVLLLAACAPPGSDTGPAETPDGVKNRAVSPLQQRGLHLRASPGGFTTLAPARQLSARYSSDGVEILGASGSAALQLRFARWGRDGGLRDVPTPAPSLGPCLPGLGLPSLGMTAPGGCDQRVDFDTAGALEWWRAHGEGLQQGWELSRRPEGVGELVLEIAVEGAVAERDGDAIWLSTPSGDLLQYTDLLAWDSTGRMLPARLDADSDTIVVRVDDSTAQWPVSIDPNLSSAAWTFAGGSNGVQLGWSVDSAGDVDGDGTPDIIVGAPYYEDGEAAEGAAFIFYGGSGGLATTPDVHLQTDNTGHVFGFSVAGAGDVNGDGYDDVIVGAPYYINGEDQEGAAYVFLGSSTGLSSSPAWVMENDDDFAQFGYVVAGAGDVDGDGYDEVLVGAPYDDSPDSSTNDYGAAFLYMGSASGPSTTADWSVAGTDTNDYWGFGVAGVGDVDGDGYDDVAIGAPNDESSGRVGEGIVSIYHGSSTGLDTTPVTQVTAENVQAFMGWSIDGAGDMNEDGYDDVVIGAPGYTGSESDSGAAYLYYGSSVGMSSSAAWFLEGEQASAGLGTSVAGVGDVDDDGLLDVVIGAPNMNDGEALEGVAYLYLGTTSGLATTSTSDGQIDQTSAYFGFSVAGVGDVDVDGYNDILIGVPGYADPDAAEGAAFLIAGTDKDADGDGYGASTDCDDTDPTIHPGADEYCDGADNDCDGLTDGSLSVDAATYYLDGDGDGYGIDTDTETACDAPSGYAESSGDCDDDDADVSPAADEVCGDAVDNDCDGGVDDAAAIDAVTYYADVDEDTYGDELSATTSCTELSGMVTEGGDCDDAEGGVNPSAEEICDNIDNDCNGEIDDDATDGSTYYVDSDGDGYGDPDLSETACSALGGYVDNDEDCNDNLGSINPDGEEVCDGEDNDCDGDTDEDDATDVVTWYLDADNDGYGVSTDTDIDCFQPDGYTDNADDCDDTEATTSPGEPEQCSDGVDNDCDGTTDETSASDLTTWYLDSDGDGFGDAASTTDDCAQPSGYVSSDTDCDDDDADVNPDGEEVCDGVDNDCDGDTDDSTASDATEYYEDNDNDGYGLESVSELACDAPTGYTSVPGDCDDTEATVSPGEDEVCDTIDNDCDGDVDESDATDAGTWFIDDDNDGYGDAATTDTSCETPDGYTDNADDCDDTDDSVNPDADEVCSDSTDNDSEASFRPGDELACYTTYNDCDGSTDEDDALDAGTWYTDADSDGYGDTDSASTACAAPSGTIAVGDDCDDDDADVNPDGVEVCDDADNDCDGTVDGEDATDASTYYIDIDDDGFGDPDQTTTDCSAPSGYVSDSTDCDDSEASVNPDAPEICDGLDNDCEGTTDGSDVTDPATWYADDDGDGYGDSSDSAEACSAPTGYVESSEDCDDADADVSPSADEVCDSIDNNCDGETDDSTSIDADTWLPDLDGDGFGDDDASVDSCTAPSGYIEVTGDCDDSDAAINPDATEVCDEADNDCDGDIDGASGAVPDDASEWYFDGDGDGYGDSAAGTENACSQPEGYASQDGDCDDEQGDVNPDADEICDGIDNDCEGTADGSDATDQRPWYADDDEDSYGDADTSVEACDAPSGYIANDTDCDDTDADVNPGAEELCFDGVDNNCDDGIDDGLATDATMWFADSDGDGYGSIDDNTIACDEPTGYTDEGEDCDDDDADINPDADEVCDAADNDCDGDVDEGDAVDATTWYTDDDGDGFGDDADADDD